MGDFFYQLVDQGLNQNIREQHWSDMIYSFKKNVDFDHMTHQSPLD